MDILLAKEHLSYAPETGDFTWKVSRLGSRIKAGDVAGTNDSLGYRLVGIGGKQILGHRLAWAMTHGVAPSGEIDHINGDPGDNRLCNLREVTHQQNIINRKLNSNNTSGVKGVSWHKQLNKWCARIKNPETGIYESLGLHHDIQSAASAYKLRAIELHGEYARQES